MEAAIFSDCLVMESGICSGVLKSYSGTDSNLFLPEAQSLSKVIFPKPDSMEMS